MKAVGLRDLKNRLAEYVRDVRRGEHILVTDRGEVVAELTAPGLGAASSLPPAVQALVRQGLATAGRPNDARLYARRRRALQAGRAAAFLAEDRGER